MKTIILLVLGVVLMACPLPREFVTLRVLNGSGEPLLTDVSGVVGYDTSTLAPTEYRDAEGEVGTTFFVWVKTTGTRENLWTFDVPTVDFTFVIPPQVDW